MFCFETVKLKFNFCKSRMSFSDSCWSGTELDNFTLPCALRLHFTLQYNSYRLLDVMQVERCPPRFSFICSPVPFMISSHQNHTSGRCSPSVSHPLAVNVVRTHTGICMGFECCLIDWLKTHDSYRNVSTGNKILDILCLLYFSWNYFSKNSSV